ncbi:MAG: S-layer homology domain-containing protein, partial [Desulfitobacteriaceae bacterium]|nr:S-layer homology domain-containing protein [Desulfitobacteriaceae bacterium]
MRKLKSWENLFIFVFLLLSFCFPQMAQANEGIVPSDIQNHWAEKQILDWTNQSPIGVYADGTFKPDKNITRAEFTALVNWAFGYTKTALISFPDVLETDSYYTDIARAAAVGYMGGYPDGTMKPNNPLTRQEAAAILMKILHPVNTGSTLTFVDEIPAWCADSIDAVVSNGYMSGYPDNTFRAINMITRAESISMLARAMGTLYNQAGIYGSAEETTTIPGHVTISQSGVVLKNTVIDGNLYLTEGIGDGHVTLENVQVKGTTQVSGGGENSIIVLNSALGTVRIAVPDNSKVRLVAQGSTTIGTVQATSACKLEEENLTSDGFGEININIPEGSKIELEGAFQTVNMEGSNIQVGLLSGTVETLTIAPVSNGASINLAEGTTVNTFMTNSVAAVTGNGTIQNANINADGVSMEKDPVNYELAEGATANIAGKEISDKTPGIPASDNSSNKGSKKKAVTAINVDLATMALTVGETRTITATIEPDNATNKNVTWESSDEGIVTVDADGLIASVTGVAEGTAIITVTTDNGGFTDAVTITVSEEEPGDSYNGSVSGQITSSLTGEVNGTLDFLGEDDLHIVGNVTGTGNLTTFTGTVSGSIDGTINASINANGIDTLSGIITPSSGSSEYPVRILGIFGQTGVEGDFEGEIITGPVPTYVESMEITSEAGSTVIIGDTLQLAVGVTPEEASDEVAWSVYVNQRAYGSIDENGLFTALAEGNVTVIAKALDGSLRDDTFVLTVIAEPNVFNSTQGRGYDTIQAAIDAADSGDMIVLFSGTTITTAEDRIIIPEDANITLDMNGQTIISEVPGDRNASSCVMEVQAGGQLQLVDNSAEQVDNFVHTTGANNTKFLVNSGTLSMNDVDISGFHYGISDGSNHISNGGSTGVYGTIEDCVFETKSITIHNKEGYVELIKDCTLTSSDNVALAPKTGGVINRIEGCGLDSAGFDTIEIRGGVINTISDSTIT